MGKEKRTLLSLRLNAAQSELAERMANKDHRSQQGEFIWLLEAYAKGELLTKDEAAKKYTQLFESLTQLVVPSRRFDVAETSPPQFEDDALPEKQRRRKSQ